MSSVEERVTRIVAEALGVDEDKVGPDSSFDDLGADSLDLVDLTVDVEEEFQVAIPDEDAETITTVGALIAYVAARAR